MKIPPTSTVWQQHLPRQCNVFLPMHQPLGRRDFASPTGPIMRSDSGHLRQWIPSAPVRGTFWLTPALMGWLCAGCDAPIIPLPGEDEETMASPAAEEVSSADGLDRVRADVPTLDAISDVISDVPALDVTIADVQVPDVAPVQDGDVGARVAPDGDVANDVASDATIAEPNLSDGNWTQVSVGHYLVCGLRTGGEIVCWNSADLDGSLWIDPAYGDFFASIPTGPFVQMSVGGSTDLVDEQPGLRVHACGLRPDQSLTCWGDNFYGQSDPPEGSFLEVSTGALHSCGVRLDGTVVCWGENASGAASSPPGQFAAVDAGGWITCALSAEGKALSWGTYDGLYSFPQGTFTQVSAGTQYCCALTEAGVHTCWGGIFSETGPYPPSMPMTHIDLGRFHGCGLLGNGDLICWGTFYCYFAVGKFSQIASGSADSCALGSDGVINCWGNNFGGCP